MWSRSSLCQRCAQILYCGSKGSRSSILNIALSLRQQFEQSHRFLRLLISCNILNDGSGLAVLSDDYCLAVFVNFSDDVRVLVFKKLMGLMDSLGFIRITPHSIRHIVLYSVLISYYLSIRDYVPIVYSF